MKAKGGNIEKYEQIQRICVIGVLDEVKEGGAEKYLRNIGWKVSNFVKEINLQIEDVQKTLNRINSNQSQSHHGQTAKNQWERQILKAVKEWMIQREEQWFEWLWISYQRPWKPEDSGTSLKCWKKWRPKFYVQQKILQEWRQSRHSQMNENWGNVSPENVP